MRRRNGSALVLCLLAVFALMALALMAAAYHATVAAESGAERRQAGLRRASEAAALRGLAELQASAGPDARHTYQDSTGHLRVSGRSVGRAVDGAAEAEGLRLSWKVTDLSMACDRAAGVVAFEHASAWAHGIAARPKLPRALPAGLTDRQRLAVRAEAPAFFNDQPTPGGSWQVRGLLTDAVRGGWKRDLSDEGELTRTLGPGLSATLLAPDWKRPTMKGYPMRHGVTALRSLSTLPVLTDFRLSLGFFNSRHDGRHRLRFHGSGVLWNPFTVPVLAGPQGRLFLVEIIGAPEVSVVNLDSGASLVVDLDESPQVDFGVVRQGAREKGLWLWTEVSDPLTYGMAGRGLLPGEVFAFTHPPPAVQPQGLARILSEQTWRLDRRAVSAPRRRPGADTFFADDRIEITVRFPRRTTIRLRAYAGEPGRDELIADYPGPPLIVLDNVAFPDFRWQLSGADYSREDSAGYVIEDRHACLRLRWRPRSAADFRQAADGLIRHHWDLARPEDAAEWSVESPLLSALDVVDHDASPQAGPLWDLRANSHDATQQARFAAWRLRDVPTWPMLSVGALRHLERTEGREWLRLLDEAFCSARPELAEPGVDSHQPFLLARKPGPAAPADWFVVGPWNLNSRDPVEWESFLRGAPEAWRSAAGGPFTPGLLQGSLFFTRPAGAGQPHWGALAPLDLPDQAIPNLDDTTAEALLAAQAVRKIPDARFRVWAEAIVRLQPECGWPFPSLEAFARSPLLTRSLGEARINEIPDAPAAGLPSRLEAADLLEAWAPVLTVRGDTFLVTGRAEGEGGACLCEMTVQRQPEEHPGPGLGRRFRIVAVRYRHP